MRIALKFDEGQDTIKVKMDNTGGTTDHRKLTHRDDAEQHKITAITGLEMALEGKLDNPDAGNDGDVLVKTKKGVEWKKAERVSVPIASEESPGVVAVGENLKISETGALSVDTTDVAEEDNTKPITSSGVNTIVGNIAAILESI